MSSIDYPVKHFVVVVGKKVASGPNAIAYQLKHLRDYPQNNIGVCVCVNAFCRIIRRGKVLVSSSRAAAEYLQGGSRVILLRTFTIKY